MKKKSLTGLQDSGTSRQFSQVLSHLQIESSANGDPMCQACGEAIVESDPVTLYLSRPAGHSGYTIGQCRCSDHNDDLTALFTLGVREIVVDGRIGHRCSHDTDQTWPVLLAPAVRLISAPDTTSCRVVSSHKQTRLNDPGQSQIADRNSDTADTADGVQSVLPQLGRDGSAGTIEQPPVGRFNDE